jgi:hypothetical protein
MITASSKSESAKVKTRESKAPVIEIKHLKISFGDQAAHGTSITFGLALPLNKAIASSLLDFFMALA